MCGLADSNWTFCIGMVVVSLALVTASVVLLLRSLKPGRGRKDDENQ
jgi:predicted Kef-type K+ transport protein